MVWITFHHYTSTEIFFCACFIFLSGTLTGSSNVFPLYLYVAHWKNENLVTIINFCSFCRCSGKQGGIPAASSRAGEHLRHAGPHGTRERHQGSDHTVRPGRQRAGGQHRLGQTYPWYESPSPSLSLTHSSLTQADTHIRLTKSLIRSEKGLFWLVAAKTAQKSGGEGGQGLAVCYLSVILYVCVCACQHAVNCVPCPSWPKCSHTNQMTNGHMEVLICFLGRDRLPVRSELQKSSWLLEHTELVFCHRNSRWDVRRFFVFFYPLQLKKCVCSRWVVRTKCLMYLCSRLSILFSWCLCWEHKHFAKLRNGGEKVKCFIIFYLESFIGCFCSYEPSKTFIWDKSWWAQSSSSWSTWWKFFYLYWEV